MVMLTNAFCCFEKNANINGKCKYGVTPFLQAVRDNLLTCTLCYLETTEMSTKNRKMKENRMFMLANTLYYLKARQRSPEKENRSTILF